MLPPMRGCPMHGERGIWGAKSFKEVESPARDAALKAVELDPQLAEGHIALHGMKFVYDWDWAGAEYEIRRALDLDSGNPDARFYYATFLMSVGATTKRSVKCKARSSSIHFPPPFNQVLAGCFIARGNTKRLFRT